MRQPSNAFSIVLGSVGLRLKCDISTPRPGQNSSDTEPRTRRSPTCLSGFCRMDSTVQSGQHAGVKCLVIPVVLLLGCSSTKKNGETPVEEVIETLVEENTESSIHKQPSEAPTGPVPFCGKEFDRGRTDVTCKASHVSDLTPLAGIAPSSTPTLVRYRLRLRIANLPAFLRASGQAVVWLQTLASLRSGFVDGRYRPAILTVFETQNGA